MANLVSSTRSEVAAFKEETTEGTLQALTAGSEFVAIREGFTMSSEPEVVETDTKTGSIGKSAPITVGENPVGECPLYNKHSGVEGQEPEFGILIESCLGDKTVNATEYDTVAASTVSLIKVDAAEGANFEVGQGLLVKDATNGYSIANVDSISTDDLIPAFNLDNAPAVSINLGKAILYKPANTHPTFSAYNFQQTTSADWRQAMAGCRVTSLAYELPARDLGAITASFEATKFYWGYFVIDATNDDFSVTDDTGAFTGSITQKVYKTAVALASEIETKMNAAGSDVFTVTYSSTTGKFTIVTDGVATLTLTCSAANSVFAAIGFGSVDLTGALTYTAASAISFDAPFTPAFDVVDPNVIVNNELFIGDATDNICRKGITASLTISTPKSNVLSICAENGVAGSLITERTVEFTSTIILAPYEVALFDKAINNDTVKLQFNGGAKGSDGNWLPGRCFNLYMANAKIKTVKAEQDGYSTIELSATGFVSNTEQDVYINYL
jgi:hypothetical protein